MGERSMETTLRFFERKGTGENAPGEEVLRWRKGKEEVLPPWLPPVPSPRKTMWGKCSRLLEWV